MINGCIIKMLYGCILGSFLMKVKERLMAVPSGGWNVTESILELAKANVEFDYSHYMALQFHHNGEMRVCGLGFFLGGTVGRSVNDYCMRNLHPTDGFSYCGWKRVSVIDTVFDPYPLTLDELAKLSDFYRLFANYIKV